MTRLLELSADPSAWLALISLAALEIVLGIDNIVFIAILTDRLPLEQRSPAYRMGLLVAMVSRIALLFTITWIQRLEGTLFVVFGNAISGRDLVLLGGGLFLIAKSTHEMFLKVEGLNEPATPANGGHASRPTAGFTAIVLQIMVLDIVFSLDSVITAVGVADDLEVMVAAVMLAVGAMLIFAESVGRFVNANPSMKILALSFLLLIGVLLTADAFDQHVNKGYLYFAMAFSLVVELLNMRFRKKAARLGHVMANAEQDLGPR